MNIVILGPPGAGKGTQIAQIMRHYDIEHLSLGDIFRAAQLLHSQLGNYVSASVTAGNLVDDETVNSLVSQRISELPASTGFVLDGFPRTEAQAKFLCNFFQSKFIQLSGVFELDVSDSIAADRLRQHAKSDKTSILPHTDETDAAIINRLKSYRSSIDAVRKTLSAVAPIFYIDASLPVLSVSNRLISNINLLNAR